MIDERPDPDALLAKLEDQEKQRGRLKVFLGPAAGSGKTYMMLVEARAQRANGVDLVAGVVETHGRAETQALLEGLEILPRRSIAYRGTTLDEFDLDAALARRPQLILVDELAHTNAPGSRHPKRWQDVQELLDAGIDVYTTLNVQHVESLKDVVETITGIRVWESVPDSIFDGAEVELIDIPPDELLQRLKEGKVYIPAQAERAAQNFFRKGNLFALRELALRVTAERVDVALREYREDEAIRDTWAAAERLLVCVGPDLQAERLVRTGRRMAAALRAEWIVVYVETPELLRLSEEERNRRIRILRLAESLGAEAVTLGGHSAAQEALNYSRTRNVTRILVGKPTRTGWRRWLKPSTVDRLIAQSEDIDVHIVSGDESALARRNPVLLRTGAYLGVSDQKASDKKRSRGYAGSVASTVLCTLIAWLMTPAFELANLVMVYLLGVVVVAARFGIKPAILVSVLNVAAFDFFFVPPQLTFAVSDAQYLVTFAIMLAVALVISNLTASIRLQARVAGHRERRTAMLYAMSRELAATRGEESMATVAVRHTSEVFESQVVVLLPNPQGRIAYPKGESLNGSFHGADLSIAQWVYDHAKMAGLGTDTLQGSDAIYLPLQGASATLGILAVLPANPRRVLLPEQLHLLETFAGQIALALERAKLADQAQHARIKAETEHLRNSLLSAISHDLRTPLAVIAGSASSLTEKWDQLGTETRRELAQTMYEEAKHMGRVVSNMLEMTRLESGAMELRRDWQSVEEIVGTVLNRMKRQLANHPLAVDFAPDLPLVRMDATLIERVFVNILENAVKYTPAGTPIEIRAASDPDQITVTIADSGPGLKSGEEDKVFDKFHRGAHESAVGGVGLGLAICRAIIETHGGRIWAERGPDGGAVFCFTLPITGTPPVMEALEDQETIT